VLHTFYRWTRLFLAFFEAPDSAFDFKVQHDFDLHIALEVDPRTLADMFAKGKARASTRAGSSTITSSTPSTFATPTVT
jgi:hypothetical protein